MPQHSIAINIRAFLQFSARTDVFFYTLLWLIFLLVAGTIVQKDIGLYAAQQQYFSSAILWIGKIPLPYGASTMTVIFLNLLAKLLMEEWKWQKTGTIIIHVGALLLLLGGFITAEFSREGSMMIPEGKSSNYISDYHKRELAIIDITEERHNEIATFGQELLIQGAVLNAAPLSLIVETHCRNCRLIKRDEMRTDKQTHGLLKAFKMHSATPRKEDEENRSGVIFSIEGEAENINGRYAVFDSMPIDQTITLGKRKYLVQMRRARTYLPFSIGLLDFEKQVHPYTGKARSYQSEVMLQDGDLKWHSLIKMNEPLRYKGYTFYQSAFISENRNETTVLAVVKNIGRMFPYISSIIMCIGLLIHLFQRMPKLMRRQK